LRLYGTARSQAGADRRRSNVHGANQHDGDEQPNGGAGQHLARQHAAHNRGSYRRGEIFGKRVRNAPRERREIAYARTKANGDYSFAVPVGVYYFPAAFVNGTIFAVFKVFAEKHQSMEKRWLKGIH